MLITLSYALDFMFIFIHRIDNNTFPLFQQQQKKTHKNTHLFGVLNVHIHFLFASHLNYSKHTHI